MGQLTRDKMEKFRRLSRANRFEVLVETGTFQGEVWQRYRNDFEKIVTIELSEHYYNMNKTAAPTNVKCVLGASEDVLEGLLKEIPPTKNIIFWLDGHWCGGQTARGKVDCPLIQECQIINSTYAGEESLVIIDDLQTFNLAIDHGYGVVDWHNININILRQQFTNFDVMNEVQENGEMVCFLIQRKK